MTGLLIKDLKLLKSQKSFYTVFIIIAFGMLFTGMAPAAIINYFTMLISMFTLSTISYDELDNGSAFLFTLPISRKQYVAEKYVFGILTGGGVWCASVLLWILAGFLKGTAGIPASIFELCLPLFLVLVFLSVMVPLQLKFGMEKSRIVLMMGIGVLFAAGFVLVRTVKDVKADLLLVSLNWDGLAVVLVIASLAAAVLSYLISVRIMNQRQF